MDKKQLAEKIEKFKQACLKKGYPLRDVCVEEAFPGDSSTSYIIKVVAEWVVDMNCSDALDILIDILWKTFNRKERAQIFTLNIFSNQDELHCWSGELSQTPQLEAAA
jgi:hypothetical protein